MKSIARIGLFSLTLTITQCFGQTVIYYDDNAYITVRELATHYRIAKVDTVKKKFVGPIKDYWPNDTVMVGLTYDMDGNKDGLVWMQGISGNLNLKGQYSKGSRAGVWEAMGHNKSVIDFTSTTTKAHPCIDSLEAIVKAKESFQVSRYIRKADYPEIYSLVYRNHSTYSNSGGLTIVEEPPYFPNGMKALGEFIGALISYPEEALKNKIKGKVIVEFTISEDGSTKDFKIVKGLGFGCDEEAIRVLKILPDWVPGYQRGKAVKTKFQLPITFR